MRIILLHSSLSRASSSFLAIALRASSMKSCHLLFGLPLLLLTTTRFLILIPTYDSSLLIMWPNHLHLVSCNFCPSSTTPVLLLTSSFLILSFQVFPTENLSIFISATSILFSCVLVTAAISIPYSNAGLTITLNSLPFNCDFLPCPPACLHSLNDFLL